MRRCWLLAWLLALGYGFVLAPASMVAVVAEDRATPSGAQEAAASGGDEHDHAHDDHSHGDAAGHADTEHAHDEHHEHHGHTIRGVEPGRDDVIMPRLPMYVWTFLVFLVTAFLLKRLCWEPILESLHQREQKIANSLYEAQRARERAEKLLSEHDEEMGRAHEEAKRLLEQAREEAGRESEAILSKARTEAARRQDQAESAIRAAKESALAQIRQSAAPLAADMVSKVVGKKIDADYSNAVKEAWE